MAAIWWRLLNSIPLYTNIIIYAMEVIENLFRGFPELWGGGVAHSVMILSLVITIGLSLGKLKVRGVSLGLAWILFAGLLFGHFQFNLDEHLLHFLKEFGLILFVYSIGLEVGPGFFSSFRRGSNTLIGLVTIVIAMSLVIAISIYYISDTPITTIAGILSGAVTNTPGLGTAQQAYSDLCHIDAPTIASGYAVTYPMGVLGVIISFIILKWVLRINVKKEEAAALGGVGHLEEVTLNTFAVKVSNEMMQGVTVKHLRELLKRNFMVSRIYREGTQMHQNIVSAQTTIQLGDSLLIVSRPKDEEPICALLGAKEEIDWKKFGKQMVSRRILITKSSVNGKTLEQMKIPKTFGVNVTRVNRSGVDLVATGQLKLQMGDKLTVVGNELSISHVEQVLGNSMKRLNSPNLIPIFLGIVLGCILANVPFFIPGISASLRLGLTGGPLIVAILIGYFGPKYNLVTYNTISANLMLRRFGLCIFLACVGLGTGEDFVQTIVSQSGMQWILYGLLITMLPILFGGIIGRYVFHINYFTLVGVLAGAHTNPPALAYVNDMTQSDSPSVGYSTVYPFAMFLRILTIQMMIFVFG